MTARGFPAPDRFGTDRLSAQRIRNEDAIFVHELHQDEAAMATLGGVRDWPDTCVYVEKNVRHWDEYGFGLWVLRDRNSGEFLGRGGVRAVTIDGKDEVEIAYAFRSVGWGRGLATELAAALVDIAFDTVGLSRLVAFTGVGNHASRRVMEKSGFRYDSAFEADGEPLVLYVHTKSRQP